MPIEIQRKMYFFWKTIIHQTFKTTRFIFWRYCVCQIVLPRKIAFIDWWESPPPRWKMSLLACFIPSSLPFQGCVYNKINFISYLWFQQWMVIENGWKYYAIVFSELFLFFRTDENIGAIAFFWTLLIPSNGWKCWCNCIFLNSSCSSKWINILVQLHFFELLLFLKMDENIGAITFF